MFSVIIQYKNCDETEWVKPAEEASQRTGSLYSAQRKLAPRPVLLLSCAEVISEGDAE